MIKPLLLAVFFFSISSLLAQSNNLVYNGSLEGEGIERPGWVIPKKPVNNHPNWLDSLHDLWNIKQLPYAGASFTCFVTRDNGSYERLAQNLS
ncbi:MAG: hypothetical protein AAGA31_02225, partial [Bacteroidota bacterium]